MEIYSVLSRNAIFKDSFSSKFLLIAFIGIHVPLIGLVMYLMYDSSHSVSVIKVCAVVLVFTLLSTMATLFVLNKLLRPLTDARVSLDEYVSSGRLPDLPVHYSDEVGTLLAHIQNAIEKIDFLMSEKGDMVDILSHDLRAPISRIVGLCTLIDTDTETPVTVYTGHIVGEAQSLIALLEDVLKVLSKAHETGTLDLRPTSLKSVVSNVAGYFGQVAKNKQVTICDNVTEDHILNLERVLFSQVLKNIVGNALKFTPEGKSIYISAEVVGDKLHLLVRDEGVGFESEIKDRLFDRFTKASRRGTRGEASTGLGLFLSQKIIRRHGGELLADSEGVGSGAVFTIALPMQPKAGKNIMGNIARTIAGKKRR